MRRTDRQINDDATINEIIRKADVIRIGLFDGNETYIVPLNFGFEMTGRVRLFYMHCANEGRKLDIIQKNSKVCFEMDVDHELIEAPMACGWTMNFKSVMGTGVVELVKNKEEKIQGLRSLMQQYDKSDKETVYDFSKLLNRTAVLKLTVEEISCKVKG